MMMAVYVERSPARLFRRKRIAIMVADSDYELDCMADKIGVSQKHVKHSALGARYFELYKDMRNIAIRAGAIEVGRREIEAMMER